MRRPAISNKKNLSRGKKQEEASQSSETARDTYGMEKGVKMEESSAPAREGNGAKRLSVQPFANAG